MRGQEDSKAVDFSVKQSEAVVLREKIRRIHPVPTADHHGGRRVDQVWERGQQDGKGKAL